jgi:hypothetical protein
MLGWQTEIGIWMMVLMVMLRTWEILVILMGIGRAERMA